MLKPLLRFVVEYKVIIVMNIFQRSLQVPVENSAPATPVAKKGRLVPSGFYNIWQKYTAKNELFLCPCPKVPWLQSRNRGRQCRRSGLLFWREKFPTGRTSSLLALIATSSFHQMRRWCRTLKTSIQPEFWVALAFVTMTMIPDCGKFNYLIFCP